jgi:glycosyltransferase involved in cell wall biosynthesis
MNQNSGINADAPFFSIVIASLNNINNLLLCVDSLNSQNFKSYEVLVSDGGSTDGTQSILTDAHIRNLKWWKSCPDLGIYYALNSAVSEAKGHWILVLGSDDKLRDQNALSRAFAAINHRRKGFTLMYSNIFIRNSNNIRLKKYPDIEEFSKKFAGAPFIHHQSAFVARKAMLNVGLFDVTYRVHADYDLMLRVIKEGSAIKIDDAFVVFNAAGYSSRFKNIIRSFNEVRCIRKKLGFQQLNLKLVLIYVRVLVRSFLGKFLLIK